MTISLHHVPAAQSLDNRCTTPVLYCGHLRSPPVLEISTWPGGERRWLRWIKKGFAYRYQATVVRWDCISFFLFIYFYFILSIYSFFILPFSPGTVTSADKVHVVGGYPRMVEGTGMYEVAIFVTPRPDNHLCASSTGSGEGRYLKTMAPETGISGRDK